MTTTGQPVGETDLLAYVDGHLDPARRRLVEQYLARDPEAARRVAEDLAIMDGIRSLFDRYYQEAVPAKLHATLRARRRPLVSCKNLVRAAAALALTAAGAAGGWLVAQDGAGPGLALLHPSEQSAVRAVSTHSQRVRGPAETLGESLRKGLRVPDLSSAGLRLVGQAVVGTQEHPAIQLTYEDAQGGRIYLYQQARSDDVEPQAQPRRTDGRGLVYWAEGPFVYAMTGEMSSEDLNALAEAAQNPVTSARRGDGIVPVVTGRH